MTNGQKSLARTSAYSDASPMARWLGFSVAMEGDEAIYSLAFDDKHIGNAMIRALHGGAIAAFLGLSAQLQPSTPILTISDHRALRT